MSEPTNDRLPGGLNVGGLSAGAGSLASIFLAHLLGIYELHPVLNLLFMTSFVGVCSLLVWFLVTRALRFLRGRSGVSR